MYVLPVVGVIVAVFCCLLGRWLGAILVVRIATACIFSSFFISLFLVYEIVYCSSVCELPLYTFLRVGTLSIVFKFYYDAVSTIMLSLVLFISALVFLYSIEYMDTDPHKIRFFLYLSLFVFFMVFMVLSSNLFQFFVGWEGVGISSYLLIGFWFTRVEASRAALKAVLVNRVGDFALYFAVLYTANFFKTLDFTTINCVVAWAANRSNNWVWCDEWVHPLCVIAFFIFIAAVGKSAQLGLHMWLPDAMEGPTPVSALLHAATMVTAGIYLLLRTSVLLDQAKPVLIMVAFTGAFTTFAAATIGMYQTDLKKIIAYSTCSQLGYMFLACGLSNYAGAFFHLFNHAFFKALLFLGAGSIIHACLGEQDIRRYGGLLPFLPFTYICMLIGSASLIGVPFTSGFYSKDFIINLTLSSDTPYTIDGSFLYALVVAAAFLTSFYSIRALYYIFFLKGGMADLSNIKMINAIREPGLFMSLPLFLLAVLSIFSGYLFYDLFIGSGANTFNGSLAHAVDRNYRLQEESIGWVLKFIPFILFFIAFLSWNILQRVYAKYVLSYNLFVKKLIMDFLVKRKWNFEKIIYGLSSSVYMLSYNVFFKNIERGWLEYFVGYLLVTKISKRLSLIFTHELQSGFFKRYLEFFLWGFLLYLFFLYHCLLVYSVFFDTSSYFSILFSETRTNVFVCSHDLSESALILLVFSCMTFGFYIFIHLDSLWHLTPVYQIYARIDRKFCDHQWYMSYKQLKYFHKRDLNARFIALQKKYSFEFWIMLPFKLAFSQFQILVEDIRCFYFWIFNSPTSHRIFYKGSWDLLIFFGDLFWFILALITYIAEGLVRGIVVVLMYWTEAVYIFYQVIVEHTILRFKYSKIVYLWGVQQLKLLLLTIWRDTLVGGLKFSWYCLVWFIFAIDFVATKFVHFWMFKLLKFGGDFGEWWYPVARPKIEKMCEQIKSYLDARLVAVRLFLLRGAKTLGYWWEWLGDEIVKRIWKS